MKYLNQMLEWNKENDYLLNDDIKRQIRKQIRIHKKYIYRLDRIEQFISFTEENFMLTTGELEPIVLYPPQKWWIELMLGYDMINDKGEQVQLVNEVFLNLGRGSGKSSLMATRVLNWMLLSGQFGGESQVIAYDNNQARHVYDQVKNQAKASNLLVELSENNLFKSTKTGLLFETLMTKFVKQTNDSNRAQGGNTSLNIFDEVHTYTHDITEAVNKGSRQKQKNWQSIYITSGGTKRNGLYDTMIKRFTSDDEFDNDRSVALLYRLMEKSQVKDKRNWSMAMPMIGYLPSLQSVVEEYELSKSDPVKQIKFLAMNMGLQMNDTAYYFTAQETIKKAYDLSVFQNAKTYIGIDLSLSNDLTSVAFLCKPDDFYYLHTINFTTQNNIDSCDKEQQELYLKFEAEGSLIILESDYIRATDIIAYVKDFKTKYKIKLTKIGYDPSRYENLKGLIDLYFYDKDSEKQVPIRQGFSMSDYIQIFKKQIELGNLKHNQDLLEWSLMNVAVRIGTSGDLMLKKKSQDEKIDTVVASVMAMQVMVSDEL
ncbi:terminase TerL endonuclease subunit [Lactococcus paracarnosus]|uniref:terminase TerL endonuclease subunit n=1 Tax=Pseudolactococcus paracarnosus TaxID=2749962 RepID=UPI001FBBFACB|nr:terminase TerL endonuclease subunit [Lactococcus paracarnosus]MCJ1998472.1 hypothetical protein [Lactococcus paracarnosus]